MRAIKIMLIVLLFGAVPLHAKNITLVLNDATILQGDMLGITAKKLVLEVERKAQTIARDQIQEIFDAETKTRLEYAELLNQGKAQSPAANPKVVSDPPVLIAPIAEPQVRDPEGHFVLYVYIIHYNTNGCIGLFLAVTYSHSDDP